MTAAEIARDHPDLIRILRDAQHVVVSTGAGVSAESGIATYRDARKGVWEHFDPEKVATMEAFQSDPALVWAWYECRRLQMGEVQPNQAHLAIARWQRLVPRMTLVTQNIDNLHERAGSPQPVIHLHGSIFEPRCLDCELPANVPPADIPDPSVECRIEPPRCDHCAGMIRPGVVWFGESLPERALTEAVQAASSCDVLVAVGTSAVVYPAAQLPLIAGAEGATVVQVNPNQTALDPVADVSLRGLAGTVLPALLAAVYGEPATQRSESA